MANIEFIYDYTSDGLRLQGTLWSKGESKTCVVCIHGMTGNVIENYFAHIIGDELVNEKIDFLFGHNRGYFHINDIVTKNRFCKRIGTTYEIFEDCLYDIDLWVNKAKSMGYEKIILMGHSLGCNKVIYYLYNEYLNKQNKIDSVIFASAPDLIGGFENKTDKYHELLKEAKENIKNGEPRKILSSEIYNWFNLSSETFLNLLDEKSNANNLPIKENKGIFDQLSAISYPILAFCGQRENKLYHQMDVIKDRAISCRDFTYKVVPGAGHVYTDKEKEVARLIIDWVKR